MGGHVPIDVKSSEQVKFFYICLKYLSVDSENVGSTKLSNLLTVNIFFPHQEYGDLQAEQK